MEIAESLARQAQESARDWADESASPFVIGLIVGQAKEKSCRFIKEGPVRISPVDLSEEGAYKACDVLIATSALGAGVDFPEAHFDKIYGIFHVEPAQLESEDIVQLLFRARALREQLQGDPPGGEHLLVAVRKNRTPQVQVQKAIGHWHESDGSDDADAQRFLDLKAIHHGTRRAGMPTRRLAVAARLRLLSTCPWMNVLITEDQGPNAPAQERARQKREIESVLNAGVLGPAALNDLVQEWRKSRESLAQLESDKLLSLTRAAVAAFLVKSSDELTEDDVSWMWSTMYSIPLKATIHLVLKYDMPLEEIVPSTERLKVSKIVSLFKKLFGWKGYGKLVGRVLWSKEAYEALASADGREAYAALQSLDERCPRLDATAEQQKKLSQQCWQVIKYLLEKYMGVRRVFSEEDGGQLGHRKRRYVTWKEDIFEDAVERQAQQGAAFAALGAAPSISEVYTVFRDCYSLVHRRI
eukprot:tig00022075_g23563.t1